MDSKFKDRFSIVQSEQLTSQTNSLEAVTLYNQGTALILKGQFNEAISPLSLASAADPSWAEPHINLTVAYSHLRRLEEAQRSADRAIAIRPKSSIAHNLKGTVFMRMRKYESALEEFLIAHELDPLNKAPIENSAVIYRRLNQHQKAIEQNLKILNIEPENTRVLHNLSIAYMDSGELRKSVQAEIKALKTVPEKKRHYIYLAKLLLDLGKRKCATACLLKEMQSFPSDPDLHAFLAVIYMDNYLQDPEKVELAPVKKEMKAYLSKAGESKSAARNTLNLIRAWQIGSFLFMDPLPWEDIFNPGKFVGGMAIAIFWNMIVRFLLLIPGYFYFPRLNKSRFELLLKSSISESELIERA